MKALGFGVAGLGAVSAATPITHDLDSLISKGAEPNKPWWVKSVDDITTEVDWSVMQRFNHGQYNNFSAHLTKEQAQQIKQKANEEKINRLTNSSDPGRRLKDMAIKYGGWAKVFRDVQEDYFGTSTYWTGMRASPTPTQLGVPKWQGTPEENSRLVRQALRLFGAATVGFVELNEKTKKMIYTSVSTAPQKTFVYEDADEPYETQNKRVIPNDCKYAIVYTTRQSLRTSSLGTTYLSDGAAGAAYDNCGINQYRLQEFLRVLGYYCIGMNIWGNSNIVGFGNFAGLGEMGRLQHLLTPEWGAMIRESTVNFTNLPLAPSKPIDFGANRFCHSCTKCADSCPSGALKKDREPSWEITPEYTDTIQPHLFNNPGKKTWYFDHFKCNTYWKETDTYCGICQSVCVFSKEAKATIHELVKPIVANTSIFNGFFYNMDEAYGYGIREETEGDSWWDYTKIPVHGIYYGEDPYI